MTGIEPHVMSAQHDDADGAELLERFKAGDREAFAAFVALHADRCRHLATRLLGRRGDAGDATQDAFLLAFLHASTFRPGASARAWLGGIVVNSCNALLRREHAFRQRHLRASLGPINAAPSQAVEAHEDTSAERAWVAEEMARLREEERLALWLRHAEGLSFREIAQRLGVPQKTIESRVQRTLSVLRARLSVRNAREGAWSRHIWTLSSAVLALFARPRTHPRVEIGHIAACVAGSTTRDMIGFGTIGASVAGDGAVSVCRGLFGRWGVFSAVGVAVVTATLLIIVEAGRLQDAPMRRPADIQATESESSSVIDHPAGTDLLAEAAHSIADPPPVPDARQIEYVVCIVSLPTDALARLVSWPESKEAIVVSHSMMRAILANQSPDTADVWPCRGARLTARPGQPTGVSFLKSYGYLGDYLKCATGPDPVIGVVNYGDTFAVAGVPGERGVLVTTARILEAQPLSMVRSQFSALRPASEVPADYPLEEPEFALRHANLVEPLVIAADQGLLLRIGPVEHHRIRAVQVRSRGVMLTPTAPFPTPQEHTQVPMKDEQRILVVTSEVVQVTPSGHEGDVAPSAIATR